MTEFAAVLAAVILAGLAVFQVALACGAPLGNYAWGGAHKVLPTKLRASSAVSVLLYAVFALVIFAKAGLVTIGDPQTVNVAMWVLVGYFTLGIFMNGISRSKSERAVMTPVAAVLAVLYLLVAIS